MWRGAIMVVFSSLSVKIRSLQSMFWSKERMAATLPQR